jgi:hypothetical protein
VTVFVIGFMSNIGRAALAPVISPLPTAERTELTGCPI